MTHIPDRNRTIVLAKQWKGAILGEQVLINGFNEEVIRPILVTADRIDEGVFLHFWKRPRNGDVQDKEKEDHRVTQKPGLRAFVKDAREIIDDQVLENNSREVDSPSTNAPSEGEPLSACGPAKRAKPITFRVDTTTMNNVISSGVKPSSTITSGNTTSIPNLTDQLVERMNKIKIASEGESTLNNGTSSKAEPTNKPVLKDGTKPAIVSARRGMKPRIVSTSERLKRDRTSSKAGQSSISCLGNGTGEKRTHDSIAFNAGLTNELRLSNGTSPDASPTNTLNPSNKTNCTTVHSDNYKPRYGT
jgi:hypothetical protein